MRIIDRLLAVTVAVMATPLSSTGSVYADAKACNQADAVYVDGSGQFRLQFAEPGPDTAVVANLVTLTDLTSEQTFEGRVIWNQGFSQPNITLSFPCHVRGEPPSNEECRYEAVLYTLLPGPQGPQGLAKLPGSDEPAALTLLLPHLARSWHYGPLQGGWSEQVPEETLALSSCRTTSGNITIEFVQLPFEGDWVPQESLEACESVREGHAEGDFMSIADGRLTTGAGFGCEIVQAEEEPASTFRLTLACGGSNRHFDGKQTAEFTLESPDRLLMHFNGQDPAGFVRCR